MIGIYQILNIVNNKYYIGSSLDVFKRFRTHKRNLKLNKHHNRHLQRSWKKYGESAFEFIVIQSCDKIERLNLEQYYLNTLKPEYNIAISAASPMENRKHSIKTIRKLTGPRGPNKATSENRIWSTERKEKYKEFLKTNPRFHNEKTKKKMSETSKRLNRFNDLKNTIEKQKKPIIDSNGNHFHSLTAASNFHNISISTICDILKGRHFKTRKKISFSYVNKNS